MKKLFTLSFLLFSLAASAQVCRTPATDHSRVIIGATDSLSTAVKAGLFNARFDVQRNEIALVAGQPCTAAYYAVYDEDYRVVIACGVFTKLKAGEVEIVKVGRPAEKCRVVVSGSKSVAKQ